jgi:hypothetical protein
MSSIWSVLGVWLPDASVDRDHTAAMGSLEWQLQHGGYDVDLLAIENVAQLLAIEPCSRSAFGGELCDELVEVRCLLVGEFTSVLEQRPAQPFERRIGLLLQAPHLVHGLAGVSDDMELVEGDPGVRQIVGHSFDEGRRHVDAHRFDVFGIGLVGTQICSKVGNGVSRVSDIAKPMMVAMRPRNLAAVSVLVSHIGLGCDVLLGTFVEGDGL